MAVTGGSCLATVRGQRSNLRTKFKVAPEVYDVYLRVFLPCVAVFSPEQACLIPGTVANGVVNAGKPDRGRLQFVEAEEDQRYVIRIAHPVCSRDRSLLVDNLLTSL